MALQESQLQTGATIFVERHGFQLPAIYSDFAAEYAAATTGVGVHDASYMGRLKATGEDGLDLLNRMSRPSPRKPPKRSSTSPRKTVSMKTWGSAWPSKAAVVPD